MARIRSIKPGAFTSESMASVSVEARWTFAGLWTYCDDEGFGKGDPRLIKGQLWPLDDEVDASDVIGYLKELEHQGMVCRFEHDGRSYLHIPGWFAHQSIQKPTASKFPVCPIHFRSGSPLSFTPEGWGEGRNGSTGALREDSCSATSRNREQGGEEEQGTRNAEADPDSFDLGDFLLDPTTEGNPARRPTLEQQFADFWAVYPNRVGRIKARAAWDKARQTVSIETIHAGAIRLRDDPLRNPKYTPHPTTWLNRGGWADESIQPDRPVTITRHADGVPETF